MGKPRHQTLQGQLVAQQAWDTPAEYRSWEYKSNIKESDDNIKYSGQEQDATVVPKVGTACPHHSC